LAVFDCVLHYSIDLIKVRASVRLTPQDNAFWIWFGADQLAHALTYLAIAFVTAILLTDYI
jgi:hypothetical protein